MLVLLSYNVPSAQFYNVLKFDKLLFVHLSSVEAELIGCFVKVMQCTHFKDWQLFTPFPLKGNSRDLKTFN